MSDDQKPFISNLPEYLKTQPMDVTVFNAEGNAICTYIALAGLELSKYVQGPGTYTQVEASQDGVNVWVYSEKSRQVIQTHVGVYRKTFAC